MSNLNLCANADKRVPHDMRQIDTTFLFLISGHRWYKKNCPVIRGVRFFKSWAVLVLFSKIYYFYTYTWGGQGKRKTSGSFWTKKRKKEMMLNSWKLKCFKTKYQPVKSIIQTLLYHKVIIEIALLFVHHSYLL